MALTIALALFCCCFFFPIAAQPQSTSFIFNGFNGSGTNITADGAATITNPGGALRLTDERRNVIGHAAYFKPIRLFDQNSPSYPNASSFSTTFVFSIVPHGSHRGGFGFAFTMSPFPQFPGAEAGHYLGILNSSTNGNRSNHIFAVEFDTVKGIKDSSDSAGNHVGININSMISNESQPAAYHSDDRRQNEEIDLENGRPIQAWIEYDGVNKLVNVTIAPINEKKPTRPLMSSDIDLTGVLMKDMYVGFSAATGSKTSSHYILGWSFCLNGVALPLNFSLLPMTPGKKESSSTKPTLIVAIAVLSAFAVVLSGILVFYILYKRRNYEDIEEWELDCPHRFRYKDLYSSTKGFKESEIIGVGGFGAVYKAVLPTTGCEVAVKKIMRNSIQGMREFAAEIESLGRLRHKNLVNLQGWCKQKNDLLLVYDYIPNGSLDSLLFNPKANTVLSWEQRFNIIKGVASGLLYLHEEWEQVVIHRDVKSSNVLIDGHMNARLGDFGLARLYDHGTVSHTTNVVGTIGYLAPELARTGSASTNSDVFAYGVLLLEVVTARRPIDSGQFVLVDWVKECQQMGRILDAVDQMLNSCYVIEEVELVLKLGLLCSHPNQEARPSIRQVTRILDGDEPLPGIEKWDSIDSGREREIHTQFLAVISDDKISTYKSSSISGITSSSFNTGR